MSIKQLSVSLLTAISMLLLGFAALTVTNDTTSAQTVYDPQNDGLLNNFKYYESFGGKYNSYSESRSYEIDFPAGFGLDLQNDRVQIWYTLTYGGAPAASIDPGEEGCDSDQSGGYKCTITWNFADTPDISSAESASLEFKVLDASSRNKGSIFMDKTGNPTGDYLLANALPVYFNNPITTPYVELSGVVSNTALTSRELAPQSINLSARTSSENKVKSVSFFINDKLEKTVDQSTAVQNSEWNSQKTDVFSYDWSGVKDLPKGEYIIRAVANYGVNKSAPAELITGEQTASLVIVFDNTQAEVCKAQQIALSELMKSIVESRTNEVKQLELIDQKVREFFVQNVYELSSYGQTIENLDNLNKNVYTNLTQLVNDSNLDCEASSDAQINEFKQTLSTVYDSLIAYRDGIIGLINDIEGASNGTN